MGTFHHGKGDLHGITVVVETRDRRMVVGRCDTILPEGVVLLRGDSHVEGQAGPNGLVVSAETFLQNAVRFGVWPTFDRLIVPGADVVSIRRLGDLSS